MVDTLEHILLTALLTPPGQARPVLVLIWKVNMRRLNVPPSEILWNEVSHRAGIGTGQLMPEIRSEVSVSLEWRRSRGLCAFSHVSGLSLCGLAHTVCSFLIHSFIARYMLSAPPRSAPEWAALRKCISHLLTPNEIRWHIQAKLAVFSYLLGQ